ncbi:hypothetical protein QNI19_32135 [Cytophagaceae bacterium DM2B3-1]|uniref:Uncharacterized protein n=1 Tax=Xanthocytophaga flava TaxID=3048013 RepID=A0ABT7CV78_9BACT|nr:hypothetical protein [Xanthocytophaga flavus]MDJ1497633.1 hypothetical protein [Xanthocytophaga flavus]
MHALVESKAEHFKVGLLWVYKDESCKDNNWVVYEYPDGKKQLVEIHI